MTSSFSSPLRRALSAAIVLAGTAGGGAIAQERVGVSSAVNPQATGTPPGGSTRQLVIGQEVVFNERIVTSTSGQTQLLFLDESAMTIGPNSDLTIDQFVYDPRTGTGKLAMSATRGVLRYVGGKLSKQDSAVTVRTNTATLAVRGGAFIANIETAKTDAIFVFGEGLTVTGTNNASQTLKRPGFQVTVTGVGGTPSAPVPVPPAVLARLVALLDGRGGASGGAPIIPTDASVIQSGIGQTVSANLNLTFPAPPPMANNQATLSLQTAASAGQTIDCSVSGNCSGQDVFTPPPPQPVAVTYAGRVRNTNGNGTARGFVDQSPNGNTAYTGGTLANGVFSGNAGGAVGTISFPLTPGSASFQGSSSGLGALTGTSFLAADNSFFYATIIPTSRPTERLFVYGGTPVNSAIYAATGSTRTFAFSIQPDAALQASIPFMRGQAGGNLPNATVSPFVVVAPPTTPIGDTSTNAAARGMQASLAVSGQGASQQSTIAVTAGAIGSVNGQPVYNGAMRGSSMMSASGSPVRLGATVNSSIDGNGVSFYGSNAISGFVLDTGSGTASETPLSGTPTTYGFAQPAVPTPYASNTSRTTQAIVGNFGGLMYSTAQSTPYMVTGGSIISTDAPNNRVQASLIGAPTQPVSGVGSVQMNYGGLAGVSGPSTFVNNSTFSALENPGASPATPAGAAYLVSAGAAGAPTTLLPPGASFCQCQYLQWGYWGGDQLTYNPSGQVTRIDRGGINTWVAGTPTSIADMTSLISQSATATYTGAALGSVFNNGASYMAAGGFQSTYNFGTQTGVATVSNFDGRSFVVGGVAPLNGANYTFSGNAGGIQGAINGTFYGPAAAETGGSFQFQSTVGPAYMASGTYAGRR